MRITDAILDKAIDNALMDLGIEEPGKDQRGVIKLTTMVAMGFVMKSVLAKMTMFHNFLALDIVDQMFDIVEIPEDKRPEVSEELLALVMKAWGEYE